MKPVLSELVPLERADPLFASPTRRQLCAMLPALGILGLRSHSALAQLITGASKVAANAGQLHSPLQLESSSSQLVDVFQWARSQAMAYVFDNGDPVGPWYEAVEPGREGFCIRDTCHQALGAHALGLERFNLNMLRRFAGAVSDAKDWCSYWEIDRSSRPAPVDYKNDAEFWYNLPSNFDLLDCCYRMYVWSGNTAYIDDPAFLNFYDRTVNDYVERWGLDIQNVMSRPRLLNVRGIFDPSKKFPKARGIPGYNEGDHTYVVGLDVLETQRAAYLAYAHIQQVRQNSDIANAFVKKAAQIEVLLKSKWWNGAQKCFYARLNEQDQLEGCGARADDPGASLVWRKDVISDPTEFRTPTSQDSELVRLLDLSHARLEYPEVSFTRIGDIVTSVMGVTLEFRSPLLAASEGNWVEVTVDTFSGLGTSIPWAEIRNLPIRECEVTIRHDGAKKTVFTNQSGPALIWRPIFDGNYKTLLVNAKPVQALVSTDGRGRTVSSARITVGAGGTIEVQIPL